LPHISYKHEITFEDSNHAFESDSTSHEAHLKAWYPIPNEEFVETPRITHLYTKLIGKLPTTSTLLRRRAIFGKLIVIGVNFKGSLEASRSIGYN